MRFRISGIVDGKDVWFNDIAQAADALRKYRELQATGRVRTLWIHYGPTQITLDELKALAGDLKS